ncbi:redoxin domain-containing protein [Luteolibacter flavescens]|uniref:Redoxin domain-containing protein n=1 Tax=Luteolibacter flavescens TaxID=1859460 RepID=A0ABT3FUI3_9BACT|nr:redoxin domain-containing protein [Luteolibacter flavescens]MCW1887248.1 redoxin domain-containing protein [Luteolibacter flavescens]
MTNPLLLAKPVPAPEWSVAEWLNADGPVGLADLRGRVVVLHAFQMLCPGCVLHGVPQTTKLFQFFDPRDVAVIGIHTVFEHHAVMNAEALRVFLHEFRVKVPVGIDVAGDDRIPQTMRRYEMRGTPSLLLIDRAGMLRAHKMGQVEDLAVGAAIQQLIDEPAP